MTISYTSRIRDIFLPTTRDGVESQVGVPWDLILVDRSLVRSLDPKSTPRKEWQNQKWEISPGPMWVWETVFSDFTVGSGTETRKRVSYNWSRGISWLYTNEPTRRNERTETVTVLFLYRPDGWPRWSYYPLGASSTHSIRFGSSRADRSVRDGSTLFIYEKRRPVILKR